MIKPGYLVLSLVCAKTTFINHTQDKFNSHDYSVAKKAKIRCEELYPESPCMKYFIKKYSISGDGSIHYNIVCSSRELRNNDKRASSYDLWKSDIGNEPNRVRTMVRSNKCYNKNLD